MAPFGHDHLAEGSAAVTIIRLFLITNCGDPDCRTGDTTYVSFIMENVPFSSVVAVKSPTCLSVTVTPETGSALPVSLTVPDSETDCEYAKNGLQIQSITGTILPNIVPPGKKWRTYIFSVRKFNRLKTLGSEYI
jgi:hypothetical protein